MLIFLSQINFAQWNQIYISTFTDPFVLSSISFVNSNTGYATRGDSSIIKTTNGGLNWNVIPGTNNYHLERISFTSPNYGYAIGNRNFSLSYILRTSNGGNNWISNSINDYLTGIDFVNDTLGYLLTDSAFVYKTTNFGTNWFILNTLYNPPQVQIDFLNSLEGYILGSMKLLGTTNGGVNWVYITTNQYFDIEFVNVTTGYSSLLDGFATKIYKTTDRGNLWQEILSVDSSSLLNVEFYDINTGWVIGGKLRNSKYSPQIFKTTNAGVSWFEQTINFANDSNACVGNLFMVDANTGYITTNFCSGGSGGIAYPRIFKTTNGGGIIGIMPISNEVPKEFSLSQNYPNPFNPITNVKYSISKDSKVKITIYDVLGREVITLVNDFKKAGYYDVIFDGVNFASGVYFYKLQAGDFTDTKKMLILK